VQILTVAEILAGEQVGLPPSRDHRTFKKAPKAKKPANTAERTFAFGDEDDE